MRESTDLTNAQLWGKVTSLALQNSPDIGLRLHQLPEFVRAFAEIKLAAVRTNRDLGLLDTTRANAIEEAAVEVARGELLDQFPLRVVAVGGGTSTNMNVNEVLASRATQLLPSGSELTIHPNDHVNRSQSSNDAYPTAARLLLARQALDVASALRNLARSFIRQAERHSGVERMGRTGWQDAVMVSVSEIHMAQAAAAERFADQFEVAAQALYVVPLGGTVLGTGVGAPDGFAAAVVQQLADITGLPLRPSANPIDAFAHADGYSALADTAARCGSILYKLSHDLRVLSSGPNGGLSEVILPKLQPGSSIMPGKVNPVVPSMVGQASFSIRAAATAVSLAVAGGEPDFNSNSPSVVASLSPALTELAAVIPVFAEKCIDGLEWNRDRLAILASRPFDSLITQAEEDGYDAVASYSV
ncbi:lyase family protein [Rhodococcus sp. JS3073]|uniref:lyase family protein n=1 Tax=Rhodococcus sp. JS3073 TaxID=3002901 RepID=UPI0022861D11|nr:lyase family protein [Rhodococcus sp. JS3073]WAM19160.1 lyase family protein [Rhodococcus sp. JS3073]